MGGAGSSVIVWFSVTHGRGGANELSEADRRLTMVGRVEVNVYECRRRVQPFPSRATGEVVVAVFVASAPLG